MQIMFLSNKSDIRHCWSLAFKKQKINKMSHSNRGFCVLFTWSDDNIIIWRQTFKALFTNFIRSVAAQYDKLIWPVLIKSFFLLPFSLDISSPVMQQDNLSCSLTNVYVQFYIRSYAHMGDWENTHSEFSRHGSNVLGAGQKRRLILGQCTLASPLPFCSLFLYCIILVLHSVTLPFLMVFYETIPRVCVLYVL